MVYTRKSIVASFKILLRMGFLWEDHLHILELILPWRVEYIYIYNILNMIIFYWGLLVKLYRIDNTFKGEGYPIVGKQPSNAVNPGSHETPKLPTNSCEPDTDKIVNGKFRILKWALTYALYMVGPSNKSVPEVAIEMTKPFLCHESSCVVLPPLKVGL